MSRPAEIESAYVLLTMSFGLVGVPVIVPFVIAAVVIFNVPPNVNVALVVLVNVGAAKGPPETNKFPDVALSISAVAYCPEPPFT